MTRIALVMHEPLGAAFAACARHVLGTEPALAVFDIAPDAEPQAEAARMLDWIRGHEDARDPVLVLCDLYGATPFNIATEALRQAAALGLAGHLLTGTNACMVLKALTDQQEDPETFSEKVRQGALRGIVNADQACQPTCD
ncbi:PTS sugar transporter subunit IIA [Castellaniella sp. GW247-6E4]|uniref:PTS sugar transporter subunit IIA n=1 Tax=Castellaniella sp. GW247-6E4 TaxID=3140380 RepID=UPI00331532F3